MSWLPLEFAKKGKVLKLRGEDDVWDDGWHVCETFSQQPEHRLDALRYMRQHLWRTEEGLY